MSAPGGSRPRARVELERLVTEAERFAAWLSTEDVVGVNFGDILCELLRRVVMRRIVDDVLEAEPDQNAELDYETRVAWHVEHHFTSRLDAAAWAMDLVEDRRRHLSDLDLARYRAAGRAIEKIDRVSVISQRNSRELELARREYRSLQQRAANTVPAAPPRNEPTDT
jgi:hypothetical protein